MTIKMPTTTPTPRPFDSKPLRRVVIESPFAGPTPDAIEANLTYARRAMADCLRRGEAPFPSHCLYTQPCVLDDTVPDERTRGIEAGFAWGAVADAVCVYMDRGVSRGMQAGIERAQARGAVVEYRWLDKKVGEP